MFRTGLLAKSLRSAIVAAALFASQVSGAAPSGNAAKRLSCVLEYLSKSSSFQSGLAVKETDFHFGAKGGRSEKLLVKGATATALVADDYLTLELNGTSGISASATVGLEAQRAKVELRQGTGDKEGVHVFLCEEQVALPATL